MANITSWATLKTEVANALNRSNFTADVPFFIQLAEQRIYREVRVRQMETALSSTIAAGVIAVPSGYREMKFAYVNSSPVQALTRKDAEWIYYNYPTRSADRTPKFFAREGSNFIFGPYPDTTYTVKGLYYKQLDLLSDSNTSNWLITDAPDLIFFCAMAEASNWIKDDPALEKWEPKFQRAKTMVQRQDLEEEFSGSPLQVTVR
jgi:hypothetical protein